MLHYVRQDDGTWVLSETRDPDAAVHLPSIEAELKLARISAKIELADTASGRACTAVAAEDEAGRAAEICFDDENVPLVLTYEPPGGSGGLATARTRPPSANR